MFCKSQYRNSRGVLKEIFESLKLFCWDPSRSLFREILLHLEIRLEVYQLHLMAFFLILDLICFFFLRIPSEIPKDTSLGISPKALFWHFSISYLWDQCLQFLNPFWVGFLQKDRHRSRRSLWVFCCVFFWSFYYLLNFFLGLLQ